MVGIRRAQSIRVEQMQRVMRKASRRGGMDKMLRSLQAQSQVGQRPRFRR